MKIKIKCNRLLVFTALILSCSESTKSESENPEKMATKESGGSSEQTDTVKINRIIVPGKSFGDVLPEHNESDLMKIYGTENVLRDSIDVGEGFYKPGSVIFKNTSAEFFILWKDEQEYARPNYIMVRTGLSEWRTANGIQIGTPLKELEAINGGPFELSGFGWDYAGAILDWKNGKMKAIAGENNDHLLVRLGEPVDSEITEEEYTSVLGDKALLSSLPVLQKMNPTVQEIIVPFNN